MIDARVVELMRDNVQIPFNNLTQDIKKDFYIITFLLAEKLPDNTPFDLAKWEIKEFSEDKIVVLSNEKLWYISLDNIYTYDQKICIDYRFYTIRD